ncbi:MAG TPA: hypothetical protein VJA16_14260 [Thermoanaerobaculia bacterium]
MRRWIRESAPATTGSDPIAAGVPPDAALGLRVHSGWAALVALSGPLATPAVLVRRRIELVDRDSSGGNQPFHAARGLPLDAAQELVGRALDGATRMARGALAAAIGELRRQGAGRIACGILQSAARPLPSLAAVLASHALVHTAEGELFRDALAKAAASKGVPALRALRIKEHELLDRCTARLGVAPGDLERHLAELGRTLGPPWRQDEKLATLAAWLALASLGIPGVL